MDIDKNARATPIGREIMVRRVVEGGQTAKAIATAVGVCPRTVR
jgi:DNA-binding NarL/FixJ family response regulator